MSMVNDALLAASYGIELRAAAATGEEEEQVSPLQKANACMRLLHIAHAFSLLYSFSWDPDALAVAMTPRNDERMLQQTKELFVDSIANRVDLPTHHAALVQMGKSLRSTYRSMSDHMRSLREDADDEDADDASELASGYSTGSSFILMRQLQDVAARRTLEEMMWWMSRSSVLDAMCSPGVVPTAEGDRWKFANRARAFRVIVPQVHLHMREFGLTRVGRVVAIETRALLRVACVRSAAAAKRPRQRTLPSVSHMMKSVLSVAYAADARDGFAYALVTVKIDTETKEEKAEGNHLATDCEFARRITEPNGVFAVAYDMRLPEYELGARRIAAEMAREAIRSFEHRSVPTTRDQNDRHDG
jgi:hypothetical protein